MACEKQSSPHTTVISQKSAPPLSSLCTDWQKEAISLGESSEKLKANSGLYYFLALKCAHEKAFLLAGGTDSAEIIADAVADLCQVEISQWQGRVSGFNDRADADTANGFRKAATLEVLRARAGHCPTPKETSN
jgi:hypothetical protein